MLFMLIVIPGFFESFVEHQILFSFKYNKFNIASALALASKLPETKFY